MSRSRDYQRGAVYEWEDEQFSKMKLGGMSLEECKTLAADMMGRNVNVEDGRGRRRAGARVAKRIPTINLPRWARTREVIAHEIAHLQNYKHGKSNAAHGGYFMWFYLKLLAGFCEQSFEQLRESAESHGLRVTTIAAAKQQEQS